MDCAVTAVQWLEAVPFLLPLTPQANGQLGKCSTALYLLKPHCYNRSLTQHLESTHASILFGPIIFQVHQIAKVSPQLALLLPRQEMAFPAGSVMRFMDVTDLSAYRPEAHVGIFSAPGNVSAAFVC